jgi:outer membrane protein assembly factor BamB
VWRVNLKDANGYAAVYGDGKLFTHCQSAWVTAINTTDGSIVWEIPDGLGDRGYAVWHGIYAYNRVYWHDLGAETSGETKCFDAETGDKLWGSWTYSMIGYYQFCCADGKIWGQQSDGSTTTGRPATEQSFACWDAFTGEELWSLPISCNIPSVAYGNLYLFYGNQIHCISSGPAPPPDPEDWPMWRGNVDTPGVAWDETAPIELDAPLWTYKTSGGISSSAAVADDKVFIGSTDYHLYCLDVDDGHQLWNFSIGVPFWSTPAYHNGRVYTGADNGTFFCLDATTGEVLYSKADGDGSYITFNVGLGQMQYRSSPIIYNDRIYVGGPTGIFYCLNLDLTDSWTYDTGTRIAGSAAIEDGYVYIISLNNNLYKFALAGTQPIYSAPLPTAIGGGMFNFGQDWATTPIVYGDYVWIGVTSDNIVCRNSTNGAQLYNTVQPNIASESSPTSPLLYGDSIYMPAGPTVVRANAWTGENTWTAWGSWEIFGSCTLADGGEFPVVYSGSEAGSMTCFDCNNGTALSWYTTGGKVQSTPAIYDGKLIFGSSNHEVYCFGELGGAATEMCIDVDRDTVHVDAGDSVVVTAQLSPGLPDVPLLVTFTAPNETEFERSAVSDLMGKAEISFQPSEEGTWSAIAWWNGVDNVRGVKYRYAFSDMIEITALDNPPELVVSVSPTSKEVSAGETVTLTASVIGGKGEYSYQWYRAGGGTSTKLDGETSETLTVTLSEPNVYGYYCEVTDSASTPQVDSSDTAEIKVVGGVGMEVVYVAVAVVAVAVIAVVAYMYLKKRK